MDFRWRPIARDTLRQSKVILHPTASITEIRRGIDTGSDDSVDLSPYVTQASHSAFDATVALSFNRELFDEGQPKPNQVLELQLFQDGMWLPCWLGIIDALTQFTLQRGTRSLQLSAKTIEQQDIWKNTKRVTPLFPQMTNLTNIAERVARSAGMKGDEIILPVSAMTTAHSTTQLADMNAWDMITQLFLPMGWTPFIDNLGRLRAADRSLQGRRADVVLEDGRLVRVGGQRQRPPKSRVRVNWLNPTLKKAKQQGKLLRTVTVTLGWFMPFWWNTVWFSDDKTQRAENIYIVGNPDCNLFIPFVSHKWIQQAENRGKLKFLNLTPAAMIPLIWGWHEAHKTPEPVVGTFVSVTDPTPGRVVESFYQIAFTTLLLNIGTGNYEVWGVPYDWVHARNTSEAFDSSVPEYVDNSADIESDFIVNEEHAKAVAIRELIYRAREVNGWSITIVDDPRIEYGDILQFTDGSQLYVLDFTRKLERGSEATLEIKGFLIPRGKVSGGGTALSPLT